MEQVLTNNDQRIMHWSNNYPIHEWIGNCVGLDSDECNGQVFNLSVNDLKALRTVCRKCLMNRDRVVDLLGAEPSSPMFWEELKQTVTVIDHLLRDNQNLKHVSYHMFW